MRKIFIIFIFISVTLAQEITFSINLGKNTFLVGEPVWICLKVENNTPDSINVNFGETLERAIVTNSKGERLSCSIRSWFAVPLHPNLGPGETFKKCYDLSGYYYSHSYFPIPIYELYEDEYKVQMKYSPQFGMFYKRKVDKRYKTVYADPVTFRVVSPQGSEKQVFENFKSNWLLLNDNETEQLGYENLLNIVNNYSSSVYSPSILSNLTTLYDIRNNLEKVEYLYRKIVDIYPNSLYVESSIESIMALYRNGRDKSIFIRLMDKTIRDNPNTEARRIAEIKSKWAKEAPLDEWDVILKTKKLHRQVKEFQKRQKKKGLR